MNIYIPDRKQCNKIASYGTKGRIAYVDIDSNTMQDVACIVIPEDRQYNPFEFRQLALDKGIGFKEFKKAYYKYYGEEYHGQDKQRF